MPHEKIREENSRRVLEMAVLLFSETGIEQTSLADIAKAAHVSLRSLYRYYESKDALIRAVVQTSVDDLWADLTGIRKHAAFNSLDGAHKIVEMVRTMLRYAKNNCMLQSKLVAAEHYLYQIGVNDIFSLSDTKDSIVTRRFVEVFREGVADGSIKRSIIEDRRTFFALAVTYRGFFNRIACICAEETMANNYGPDDLIKDFSQAIYQFISTGGADQNA